METFNIGPIYAVENGEKVEYRYKLYGSSHDESDYEIKRITKKGTETRVCRIPHCEIALCRQLPTTVWRLAVINAQGYYLCTLIINKRDRKDIKVRDTFNIYRYDSIGANRIYKMDNDNEHLFMLTWLDLDQKITTSTKKLVKEAFRTYNKLNKLVQVKRPRKTKPKTKEENNNE